MAYRDDVAALAARQASLSDELTAKTRELEAATRLLDEAKEKARLPVLPNIYVASPCPADWSKMTGDERVRMCGQCNKHVFNLSNMTRDEAEELIIEKHGDLCVRYYQRKDGTILLKDCTVGASAARKRKLIAAGAAALLAGGGLAAWAARRGHASPIAPDIATSSVPQEDWRVREQVPVHVDPPPPPPPPQLQLHEQEWQVTGGAVAISPEDLK